MAARLSAAMSRKWLQPPGSFQVYKEKSFVFSIVQLGNDHGAGKLDAPSSYDLPLIVIQRKEIAGAQFWVLINPSHLAMECIGARFGLKVDDDRVVPVFSLKSVRQDREFAQRIRIWTDCSRTTVPDHQTGCY